MRNFTTPAQADAARNNGSKSNGPTTPEGKKRSSMNALTHGYYAGAICLANELPAVLDKFREGFYRKFKPADVVEICLVEDMIACQWRIHRVRGAQTELLNMEMIMGKERVEGLYGQITEPVRIGIAVDGLAQTNPSFAYLHLLESRLRRQFSKAVDDFYALRNNPLNPPAWEPDFDGDFGSSPQTNFGETNPSTTQPPSNEPPAESAQPVEPARAAAKQPYRVPPPPDFLSEARFQPLQTAEESEPAHEELKTMAAGRINLHPNDE